MDETVERLQEEVAEGSFTKGVQASVSLGGERVLDVALGEDGLGRPMERTSLMRVYCAIKPVTAVAIARLVEDGALRLDEPLHDRLPVVASLTTKTSLRHVLNHTAGLHRPTAVGLELVPPAERGSYLEAMPGPAGWRVGTDAAYSECLGWHLLGRLIEDVTGTPLREHLRRNVLDPFGLGDTYVGMTGHEFVAVANRLGVNVDLRGWRSYPMLFERTERVARETNCAHGGYTTASDLCHLYGGLLRACVEPFDDRLPSPSALAEFTTTSRRSFDAVLDRDCSYGLGFMTNLAEHHFGRQCSPRSFGHSGYVGSSMAFADPEHGLAVGIVFNGIVDAESAFLRRPAVVRSIYRDLGLEPRSVPSEPTPAPATRRRWRRH